MAEFYHGVSTRQADTSVTTPLSVFVIYAIVQSLDLIKVAIGYGLIRKGIWISTIVD